MESSVVFAPNIPDRELDKEVQKIDDSLADVDTSLSPEMDPGGVGGVGGAGGGGLDAASDLGGGGGLGGGGKLGAIAGATSGMASTLSSRLPSPVPGITSSAVLPVALAGAAGLGMLSAMQSASAQLQATTGMMSTAMNLFFRPFGNFLGEAFRPMANDMIQFSAQFSDLAQSEGLAVAVASLAPTAATAFGNAIADIATGEGDLGDISLLIGGGLTSSWLASKLPSIGLGAIFGGMSASALLRLIPVIGIGAFLGGLAGGELGKLLGQENLGSLLGALTGGTLAGLLGTIGIGGILTKLSAGATTLGTLLGTVGIGTIVTGVGSVAAFIAGTAMLVDLIDGDISEWNIAGQFGHALGEGFQDVFPNIAEDIRNLFTKNPVHDAGQATAEFLEENSEPGSAEEAFEDTFDTPTIPREREGVPQTTGGTSVTREEREIFSGSGGGGGSDDTSPSMDEVNRNLRRIRDELKNQSFKVGEEEFGRLTTETRNGSVFDVDQTL